MKNESTPPVLDVEELERLASEVVTLSAWSDDAHDFILDPDLNPDAPEAAFVAAASPEVVLYLIGADRHEEAPSNG